LNPRATKWDFNKFNEGVAKRFAKRLPKQRVEELFKRFEREKDESRKRVLWFKIQGIVAPAATLAFFEEVASMSERDFERLVGVIVDSMEKKMEEVGRTYFDYETALREPLAVIEEAALTAGLYKKIEKAVEKEESLVGSPRLLARLLTFASMREFGAALAFVYVKPLFDVIEAAKTRLSVDENWVAAIAALSLEENLLKMKLSQLGLSGSEIKDLGKDFYKLVNKAVELIEAREHRPVSMDVLLSSGYRKVRNKLVHEGYLWKPERSETNQIVAHVLKLSLELWANAK